MNVRDAFDQKTLHLILPSKVALVMDLLSKSSGEDPVALMKDFYSSRTYEELRDESSKYWWFSPAELCELYRRELSTKGNTNDDRLKLPEARTAAGAAEAALPP